MLSIGEKALSKRNDQKMKNLFFSVFVFCIKYTSKFYFSTNLMNFRGKQNNTLLLLNNQKCIQADE